MKTFEVKEIGLIVDGRGIMPGSLLVLKSDPPAPWKKFGQIAADKPKEEEKELVVATPPKDAEKKAKGKSD